MPRFRLILGLVAGAVMIASSAVHSIFGWRALAGALADAHVPGELVAALGLGWRFGGAAMLAFGVIVVALFTHRLKGSSVTLRPAIVIGLTYVAFGAWALAVSRFDPFFLIFVVPGAVVLTAALSQPVLRPT
jgi:hypothetical protein